MVGIALNTLLMLVVAIAIPGVINRTRATLAGRKGLPFVQHLRNVRLLLRKGSVYSPTTTALFRIAPAVYLGAAIVALLFMPVADLYPLISFEGDVICFAYTLALARVAIILAAMDTGSSFEGMGAAREALYGALIEPALMIGFATLAMFCGYTSFADIFAHEQSFNAQITIVMFLIAYLFITIAFVESGRVPVDDPRTHLELTMIHEVMCLDYSGIDMGMIHIAGWLKTACFSMIAANAIAATCCFHWWFAAPLSILLTGLSIGFVESTQARNKLVRNTTFIVTISALAALIFFIGYLLQSDINI
ncbi:MAG: NADH-quinone oxidoreductase subunit H [Alistipes sp.]|jgi:formate hydrogenlyase subunit 4|nr:NADH-quinone oxidoreductase subunit H [Alistipes sp.]MBQ5617651.1 NADH-quinone oxidoreductase subunit H [Alistipes sp.]MBQ5704831.1 NADH-quinone oxidoreductase subunit H [Alistipes sp.]MBQ5923063.1 NADH-quinone oxidoreductase subunit H [Alistipes sp.]MBQ6580696.1 NADH-quinone oxidoreductase subunit H [Alistipes sp.]